MHIEQADHLKELARILVSPDRFQKLGGVVLAPVVKLPLPEMARLYNFPEPPDYGNAL